MQAGFQVLLHGCSGRVHREVREDIKPAGQPHSWGGHRDTDICHHSDQDWMVVLFI